MNKFFKIILITLLVFTMYKIYLTYNDFYIEKTQDVTNLSHMLYLIVADILLILIIFSINLFLYVIPFLNKNHFKSIDKEKYKKTMINPENTHIFWAFSRNNIDIAKCILFRLNKEDGLDRIYRLFSNSYLRYIFKMRFYFFGIYIRIPNKIKNKFEIFASKNLMSLYHDGIIMHEKKIFLTDNSEFNKKFYLYPNNITDDFKFLNPKKLANIVQASKNINKKFSIIYNENYLEVYIHNFIFSSNIKNEYQSIMKIIKEFNEK